MIQDIRMLDKLMKISIITIPVILLLMLSLIVLPDFIENERLKTLQSLKEEVEENRDYIERLTVLEEQILNSREVDEVVAKYKEDISEDIFYYQPFTLTTRISNLVKSFGSSHHVEVESAIQDIAGEEDYMTLVNNNEMVQMYILWKFRMEISRLTAISFGEFWERNGYDILYGDSEQYLNVLVHHMLGVSWHEIPFTEDEKQEIYRLYIDYIKYTRTGSGWDELSLLVERARTLFNGKIKELLL